MVRASKAVLDELTRVASRLESWSLEPAAWEAIAATVREIASALERGDDRLALDLIDDIRVFGPARLGPLSGMNLDAQGGPGRQEALDHLNLLIGRPAAANDGEDGAVAENASP
jgi:hypothetical protein